MTLNEVISLYTLTQVKDAYGKFATTRTLLAQAYAAVQVMSGAERNISLQTTPTANYRFYVHYSSDITPAKLLVWNGVDYNIRFIADNGPKEVYMMIEAEKGVAN